MKVSIALLIACPGSLGRPFALESALVVALTDGHVTKSGGIRMDLWR